MSRPLRITFPGVLYPMTSRGNAQAAIYADDAVLRTFLAYIHRSPGGIIGYATPTASWITTIIC
jgi:hypothetical protein